jgi:hypothetical protein
MSKDNAKYNFFSIDTVYLQLLTKFPIKRKKKKSIYKKMGLKVLKRHS